MAIAHKILIAAYHMLAGGVPYRELGEAFLDQQARQRTLRTCSTGSTISATTSCCSQEQLEAANLFSGQVMRSFRMTDPRRPHALLYRAAK